MTASVKNVKENEQAVNRNQRPKPDEFSWWTSWKLIKLDRLENAKENCENEECYCNHRNYQ
jgi:hypothetical protein